MIRSWISPSHDQVGPITKSDQPRKIVRIALSIGVDERYPIGLVARAPSITARE